MKCQKWTDQHDKSQGHLTQLNDLDNPCTRADFVPKTAFALKFHTGS